MRIVAKLNERTRPAASGPILALLLVAAATLAGCARAPAPDVLLVTVDTLRPDALGFIGGTNATPNIDALARDGLAYTGAVSPVPLTLPAHTSLLSSRVPHVHGVHDNGQLVPATLPLLQERFRSAGYRTGAFVSGFPLQAMFGLDRAFDVYDDRMPDGEQGWVERRAEQTIAAASEWLRRADARPAFTWVHLYDPHDPYEPSREFWQAGPRGAYDGEVVYVDYWFGKLVEVARERAAGRPLLIVLTADHGEALGEHGELTHGLFVYDSTVLVPLVFHWPGRIAARRSDAPVRLIDVAPTIVELAGLDRLDGAQGRSVAGDAAAGDVPAAVVETWLPWTYFGWAPLTAWRERGEKYIDAPTPERYDLAADPHERTNLAPSDVARSDRLALRLADAKKAPAAIAAASADDAAIAKLRSLGYVGVGSTIDAPPAGLADPKDRIAQRDQLQEAERMLRARRLDQAQALFAQVLEHDPDNRFALLRSGVALLALDRAAEARHVLQRAVTVEPRRAESRFALGDALMRLQRYDEAAEQWSVLAELQPRRAEAWFNLAAALEKAGHADRAATARAEYDRLRAARPDSAANAGTP